MKEYSDLVFRQSILSSKKNKDLNEQAEQKSNESRLTKMELQMPAKEIIESIREAFKHIPPRQ